MNPFRYGQIVSRENFCGRPELSQKLISCIKSGQNIYVQGERRTGKTSLICEAVRTLKKHQMVYVDLMEVKSSDDFVKRMVMALISKEETAGFIERVLKKLSHIRPVVSFDPVTGLSTIAIDSSVDLSPDSIFGVMDLITSSHSKTNPLVIVFDEFQDVLGLSNAKETLAILRRRVQFHTDIPYVFAGSIRNRMDRIFNDPDSAFFKSAIPVHVGSIEKEQFGRFIITKFSKGKKEISQETLNTVFKICHGVPGDIQQLCSALWDITSQDEEISNHFILPALKEIFAHESKGYETTLKIVSKQQLKLLTALARLSGKAPMSSDFLRKSGIPQASSIRTGLKRLIDLKIVFHYEDEYRFINPFFRAWLLYKRL